MAVDYAMGHSGAELQRLCWQAEVLRPYTERHGTGRANSRTSPPLALSMP